MDLVRLGKAPFEKAKDAVFRNKEEMRVAVIFRNFGLGSEKTSDFRVDLRWYDMEKIIAQFAATDEPSAIALRRADALLKRAKTEAEPELNRMHAEHDRFMRMIKSGPKPTEDQKQAIREMASPEGMKLAARELINEQKPALPRKSHWLLWIAIAAAAVVIAWFLLAR